MSYSPISRPENNEYLVKNWQLFLQYFELNMIKI